MQAVVQRAVTAARTEWDVRTDLPAGETVADVLTAEFPALATETIERCVAHTGVCLRHLGLPATPGLVELIAREHLLGLVNSVPPSGRQLPFRASSLR